MADVATSQSAAISDVSTCKGIDVQMHVQVGRFLRDSLSFYVAFYLMIFKTNDKDGNYFLTSLYTWIIF